MSATSTRAKAWVIALLVLVATGLSLWGGHAESQGRAPAGTVPSPQPSCPDSLVANGHDYQNRSLSLCSFVGQDLTNANFNGARLEGVLFIKTNLTGADFSGATFVDSGSAALPNDFTMANLTNAKFIGAKFEGTTYLTHATLSCADFSNTDLTNRMAVFGDARLLIDSSLGCRTKFRQTVLSCEFVNDWSILDLTHATGLQACAAKLLGFNFSGAVLDYADLSSIDLTGTTWSGASLRFANFEGSTLDNAKGLNGASNTRLAGANFIAASLKGVDFRGGLLNGADFSRAELSGANFSGATLINDPLNPLAPITQAAKFDYAHLKYVNFRGATLNSVSFKYASLYGAMLGVPPAACQTDTTQCGLTPVTGGTCSCATLADADLTRADFSNAFLYGVDFSSANRNTKINGTTFTGSLLVSANFSGAAFTTDTSSGGQATSFDGAWLQGANLGDADLTGVSLSGAFVDFGVINADGSTRTGALLAIQLTANHTRFRGWTGSTTPCVHVENASTSSLPTDIGTMTCPDGSTHPGGCGALNPRNGTSTTSPICSGPAGTNPFWCAGAVSQATPITGWYRRQSTYEEAAPAATQCKGQLLDTNW